MPNNCMIIGCTHREGKDGVKMYRIPSVRRTKGEKIEELTARRQRLWLAAISRKGFDKPTDLKSSHRVCSDHFVTGKPSSLMDETHLDWVPTLKLGHGAEKTKQQNVSLRLKARNERKDTLHAAAALVDLSTTSSTTTTTMDIANETGVPDSKMRTTQAQTDVTMDQLDLFQGAFDDMQRELIDLQSKLSNALFHESKLEESIERCNFHTGLS